MKTMYAVEEQGALVTLHSLRIILFAPNIPNIRVCCAQCGSAKEVSEQPQQRLVHHVQSVKTIPNKEKSQS